MYPYKDHTIQVNGIHLHFIEYPNPNQPTLVLLHGLTANAHAFDGLIAAGLDQKFHLICIDLRGRGQSDQPLYNYSFKDHALDVIGVLDALKIKKTILGGHSFGGLLTAYMAVHFAKRIEKVILIDAAASLNPKTYAMLLPTLSRLDKSYPNPDAFMAEVKQAPFMTFWTDEMKSYYDADLCKKDDGTYEPIPKMAIMNRVSLFVANEDWKTIFKKIKQATLLINGIGAYALGEAILPEALAEESLVLLKQSTYLKVNGNHHTMLYGEDAQIIVKGIETFTQKGFEDMELEIRPSLKVAVVGATGVVGAAMLQVLEERDFPMDVLVPVASARSAGSKIMFKDKEYTVLTPEAAIEENCDIALFSAGGNTSLKYAPLFAAKGTTVIDNSSAWRMDADKKLVVPEVNADVLTATDKIIANPNCSTIQLVAVLKPLHDKFTIKRVVVSTYQSVSGSGMKGLQQLKDNQEGKKDAPAIYPFPIHENILPHIDEFTENGYTKEELKMINETKKIMGDDKIQVTATTVRVPVRMGHSESVNIQFEKEIQLDEVVKTLLAAPGIILMDNPAYKIYPIPLEAEGKDEVFVGRVRMDESQANTINCWIVADNLRKGAATNAVQIAEVLLEKNLIGNH